MGMEHYESAIQDELQKVAPEDWRFHRRRLAGVRVARWGDIPVPARATSAPLTRRLIGSVVAGRLLSHRFDLRLPPGRFEVITIHDLPPLRFTDEGSIPRTSAREARAARRIICPSHFAASEVSELLGTSQPVVIPYGLSDAFVEPVPAASKHLAALGIQGPFVLHAAGASDRKNLSGLAGAWEALDWKEGSLVLCGPPDERRDRLFRHLKQVVLLGRQTAPTVAGLMKASAAVVVPSLYEGFGLPALEGMACGVPVVAARCGALPEVVGDAGLLVDPTAEALANGLDMALHDSTLRSKLATAGPQRAKTFSWRTAAQDHLAVYEQAFES